MIARSALVTTSALLPACLTQNVQYEPPRNYPPSIESAPAAVHPLNSVIQLPTELGSSTDDGGTTSAMSIPLVVDVRDPNVDQRLRYRLFIDFNPADPRMPELEIDIPPLQSTAEDRLTRRVEITLPVSGRLSMPGCHRIEVLVAGLPEGFQNSPNGRLPRVEGDLATATWWVARQPDEGGPVDMRDCP